MEKYFKLLKEKIAPIMIVIGAIADVLSLTDSESTFAKILLWGGNCLLILGSIGAFCLLYQIAVNYASYSEKLKKFDLDQLNSDIADVKTNIGKPLNKDYPETCPVLEKTYMGSAYDADKKLCSLITDERPTEIKELHIICYGRNGFGGDLGPVQTIIKMNLDIHVKIIVFDAKSHPDICLSDDEQKILGHIKNWKTESNNIEVIVTKIPPMIRAAVAYSKDNNKLHAIWGNIQAYRFRYLSNERKITPEKYTHSLISVADARSSTSEDFNLLVRSFEEEFERLQNYSSIATLNTEGEVVC